MQPFISDAGATATTLPSIVRPSAAVVVGASGGIGGALTRALIGAGFTSVHALSRRGAEVAGAVAAPLDLMDEASIAAAADRIEPPLGLVIVATGVLHGEGFAPEKSFRAIEAEAFARVFALNATGPALIAKHFLPKMAREGKAVFAALSARVGSISDNRLGGWHAYRASKAALNMLICNFAIEMRARAPGLIVAGLHPGTVDTDLSKPFQRNVAEGRLFTPDYSAARLLQVIDGLELQDSGRCFAWDGAPVPA